MSLRRRLFPLGAAARLCLLVSCAPVSPGASNPEAASLVAPSRTEDLLAEIERMGSGDWTKRPFPRPVDEAVREQSLAARIEANGRGIRTALVSLAPRFLLVAAIAVLGILFLSPEIQSMGANVDFEKILPIVVDR